MSATIHKLPDRKAPLPPDRSTLLKLHIELALDRLIRDGAWDAVREIHAWLNEELEEK